MEGPRATRIEEFDQVIDLINHVFRIDRGEDPTMAEEFPLLLIKENVNNMRIIKEDYRVVSTVNFMNGKIFVEGVPISYSAIGGVCTYEQYRNRGYSSLILEDVEKEMKKQGTAICLISGTRSLYTRWGALVVKSFNRYDIKPKQLGLNFELKDYEDLYLREMNEIYQACTSKYDRSIGEFSKLIHSSPHPWGDFSYVRKLMVDGDHISGYVVLRIIDDGHSRFGEVVEVGGKSQDILDAVASLSHDQKLDFTSYFVHVKNPINEVIDLASELDDQQGTIKIIDHHLLIDQLRGYFKQYMPRFIKDELETLKDGSYGLKLGQEEVDISGEALLTRVLFEEGGLGAIDLKRAPNMEALFSQALPLPMPYTKNLNYQ